MVIAYYRTLDVLEVLDYYHRYDVYWLTVRTTIGAINVPADTVKIIKMI